ncbi:Rubrerythrin [Desulfovibrio sp. X2]|uniref:ferritin family protein n=1 Tax=Desulfovibrio sp. X2 TaxID=941449 RepID=UPI000358747B|nr:ferritin family protein [Desulfovibrio sp. X2]EPR37074.1 Rubrerythrin [Desulfovibrio sp. X2]
MPEFASPFAVLAGDRKLSHSELVRAVRYMIAAEYEAIQLYTQLAESTDHALARRVLVDIADEEREHVGEFLRLLRELDPMEEAFYEHGAEEVEEMIEELREANAKKASAAKAKAPAANSAKTAKTAKTAKKSPNKGRA